MAMIERPGAVNTLVWDDGVHYEFEIERVLKPVMENGAKNPYVFKGVYSGRFIGDAPGKAKPYELCCLKLIYPQSNKEYAARFAQARERYELVDFGGDHVREILAQCKTAQSVERELKNTGDCSQVVCYTVEPYYSQLEEEPKIIGALTPWERLDYVWQYSKGLLEMQADANMIFGRRIDANRDVKLANGLIEREENSFRVRIDDLASIHFEKETDSISGRARELLHMTDGTCNVGNKQPGTAKFPLSPENTAPENVDAEYAMSEKVDVYGLGTMLAGMFGQADGKCNPSAAWCAKVCGWDENANGKMVQESLSRAFTSWKLRDCKGLTAPGNSWLEQALQSAGIPFQWNGGNDIPEATMGKIKELFFDATHIHPNHRISLKEFSDRVLALRNQFPESRSFNGMLYKKPVSVFLYDLVSVINQKVACEAQTRIALKTHPGSLPVKCISYTVKGDVGLVDGDASQPQWQSKWSGAEVVEAVRELSAVTTKAGSTSLTEALKQVNDFFCWYSSYEAFHGEIHIFTTRKFTYDSVPVLEIDNQQCSCREVIGQLRKLASPLNVYVHCPEKPEVDEGWYTWVPMDKVLIHNAASAADSGKRAAWAAYGSGFESHTKVRGNRNSGSSQNNDSAPKGKNSQKAQHHAESKDVCNDFVMNSEGLCFLSGDGVKVYVGKKIRR